MRTDIIVKRKVVGWVDVEQIGTTHVVTTHSGFRATLPMCIHDAHVGRREVCLREVGGMLWSTRCTKNKHCHAGHPEHLDVFVKVFGVTYAIQPGTGGLVEHVHCPDGAR